MTRRIVKQPLQWRREEPAPNMTAGPSKINAATKPTIAPTVCVQYGISAGYDARYQCAPGARPEGIGAARAGVGVDPMTGRAWA